MHTKDFSVFTKMVALAKAQNLEYKILYSHYQRESGSHNIVDEVAFVLTTNLFSLVYDGYKASDYINAIKDFIKYNDCIKVDFKIKFNANTIELCEL